jgi:hypothetical protein
MAKNKVSITDSSIKSGVTSDAKKAICEFIWNGFDANAFHVELSYVANEIGFISSLIIKDDGDGISRSMLDSTFGKYQDSIKRKSFQWSSQVKGHRGKGRYAFNCFATRADWVSICKENDKLLKHHISIDAGDNDHFNDYSEEADNMIVHDVETGTEVTFTNVDLTQAFFESDDFTEYLKKEFAVFLKLNENAGKYITVNGKMLDYNSLIAETDTLQLNINDEKDGHVYGFHLTFVRWKEKMKENYCSYFLDDSQIEHFEKTTTLNNKDTDFHHSVYVISSYFNSFVPPQKPKTKTKHKTEIENQNLIYFPDFRGDKTEKDQVFKQLLKKVKVWILEKEKEYISHVAGEELWAKFEKNGTVTKPTNKYELPLYEDLKQTVKGIYSVQPKIFTNIKKEQAKTLVGCLNLLLQTDKREDLITIIESVVKMSAEERHRLAEILQVTELSYITNTISLLENRLKTVSAIKAMLFDKSLNAYEVPDVQKMVSSAFWLFGEQYNIVTEAEPDFQQALERYLNMIRKDNKGVGKSKISVEKLKHPDVNKEMDIFAFRQTKTSNAIENIIVELKRPNIKLGELELSQVKTYMRLIYQQPQFNSTAAKWTFILVGNELDNSGTIEGEYLTNKTWGKKDLVYHVDSNSQNYEIYVKTWSTLFDDFEMRHNFLLQKLQFRRDSLSAKYSTKKDLHNIVEDSIE